MTAAPELLNAMRDSAPLVHCITNYVAMNISANVLLAAGASPAMIHTVEETGDFAPLAGALTVNIGTLSPPWVAGMEAAVRAARGAGKPWVLDPVAHFATPYRSDVTAKLLGEGPTVLRGNASEILALAGAEAGGKGVDATDEASAAIGPAVALARAKGCIVAVTGVEDFVTDGTRALRVRGGHPLMPKVTALGCSLTALIGAYLAVGEDPLEATAAALAHFAVAGAAAGQGAMGPGSFAVAFLDALSAVEGSDLAPTISDISIAAP